MHLVVAAGAAGNQERLAVLDHEGALQRAARAFAGLERVGMTAHKRKVIAAAIERESEIAHHHFGAEARCAGWE